VRGIANDSLAPHTEGAECVLDVAVKKRYVAQGSPDFVLEANFRVTPGFTILAGPSGAGKSTMLRCIAGLVDPDEGRIVLGRRILFDSQQKIRLDPAERKVAFVFQRLALFPHLTVEQNVGYGLRKMGVREREERIRNILESFHVSHLRKLLPRQASGGEQQRIALARSLVTEPALLLLDEPLSSLDVGTKSGIVDDLRLWNEKHAVPILYVTHNHEEMFALGEQVIVFDSGGMMSEGLPVDVVSQRSTPASAARAEAENLMAATVVRWQPEKRSMICRLGNSIHEIEVPLAYAPLGSEVILAISRRDIVLARARPEFVGDWNILRGTVGQIEHEQNNLRVSVDCGVDLQVELPETALTDLQRSPQVWVLIKPESCRFVRIRRLRPLQRVFLFVCNRNAARSPLAAAICNAEIAHRLRIPPTALAAFAVRAMSAGLSATAGEAMPESIQQALGSLGISRQQHAARNLTPELVVSADTIFCMTSEQRDQLLARFPEAALKTKCLDESGDLPEPAQEDLASLHQFAAHLRDLIRIRLEERLPAEL
jgi:molybdenum ABC transporter ATP-binding protein